MTKTLITTLITLEQLREFASIAQSRGTQDAFIAMALQWAQEAHNEVERLRHNNQVLKNAVWKACGDDEESVNATIESQGELK